MQVPFGIDKGHERWNLPQSGEIDVRVQRVEFDRWDGPLPESTWNRKPVVGSPERPFAELAIAHELAQAGRVSAWVTSGQYLSALAPKRHSRFPPEALGLLALIRAASPEKGGCWDVYAWRAGVPLFAELKWPRDRVRSSQRTWMDSAIQLRVSSDCFILVECDWRHLTSSS